MKKRSLFGGDKFNNPPESGVGGVGVKVNNVKMVYNILSMKVLRYCVEVIFVGWCKQKGYSGEILTCRQSYTTSDLIHIHLVLCPSMGVSEHNEQSVNPSLAGLRMRFPDYLGR